MNGEIVKINNCINRANIYGNQKIGGIVGDGNTGTIEINECKNYGTIDIKDNGMAYSGIGGIIGVGAGASVLENCENYGTIGKEDTTEYAGGIIGVINNQMEINNCSNFGKVTSKESLGGIVGLYRAGENVKIYNNKNLASIEGVSTSSAGGIIGSCNLPGYTETGSCYIENCYNIGSVKANGSVGGICGGIGGYAYKDMKVYINNCYNAGTLTGNPKGGAVGSINNNGWGQKAQYLYTNNVYYLSTVAEIGLGRGSIDEGEIHSVNSVNTADFVNILNNYEQYPAEWKKWKLGEDGYPTFE